MARKRTVVARLCAFALAFAALPVGTTLRTSGSPVVEAAPAARAPARMTVSHDGLATAARLNPPSPRELRRVLMVGDSTLAAVRNVTASQRLFVGFEPILDAQGCRRLVWPSCLSDSDFRIPNTVEEAILGTPGNLDVVIVMSGYNDWHDPFGSFVDTIMDAARSKGAEQVVWLTLSAGQRPETSSTAIGVFAENTQLLWESAPRHPDLVIADWRTYNQRTSGWMSDDGVHLRTRGAYGLADYMSRWMAHLEGRACTAPLDPGGISQSPCPNPNTMTRVPDIRSLYGV